MLSHPSGLKATTMVRGLFFLLHERLIQGAWSGEFDPVRCSEAYGVQERAYFQALQPAAAYELTSNQLFLREAAGKEVARFHRIG